MKKQKKENQEQQPDKEKEIREEEYTDQGTVYEEDDRQLYPKIKEEKGIETGKEGNEPDL